MNPEIDKINKTIAHRYGNFPKIDHLPRFRVVWSSTQVELLRNTEIWYGKLFIGIDKGVREVLKYPEDKDKWILEMLVPNDPEITNIIAKYSYEPIFIFKTKTGEPLTPNLRAVNLLCYTKLYPEWKYRNYHDEQRKALEKDTQYILDWIQSESPYMATMLHNKEAVVVP